MPRPIRLRTMPGGLTQTRASACIQRQSGCLGRFTQRRNSMDILSSQNNYASLSVRDLLDARNQFHVHMLNKRNVVGTAVGLYLIRHSDPWPDAKNPVKKTT